MNPFRECLVSLDLPSAFRLWGGVFPHLPRPTTNAEMLIVLHRARTEAESIPHRLRVYSHQWLLERNLPSAMMIERPTVVEGVGIIVKTQNPVIQKALPAIVTAMTNAVEDAYAEGRTEPSFVKTRMTEARKTELQRLFG